MKTGRETGHRTANQRRRARVFVPAAIALLVACNNSGGQMPSAAAPVCGNGVQESGEECDDGNADNGDACLTTCRRPVVWIPGDPHVHGTGCSHPAAPDEVAALLQQQQLQVGAVLVWGWDYDAAAAYFTGHDHPLSTPGFILHYDLELSRFAAAKTGHLLLLGLDSLAFSSDVFDIPQSGVPVVDWAHQQPHAVVGMAHAQFWPADGTFPVPPGGCCTPWEVVVHAARGRLDFLSMERTLEDGPGSFLLWKALQNAGFRVPITGGSDWSCLTEHFDDTTMRTDVIADGALSYDGWLQGIKAGRCTAAHGAGNHLNLRVEGHRLGEEVTLGAPQDVTVTLENEGAVSDVDVLVNGEPAARVSVAAGRQLAQLQVHVSKSSWIAARSRYVLTNPVYVLVAGQPIRASSDDICYLQRSIEHLQELVAIGGLRLYASEQEALQAYGEARAELVRRFAESGGQVCP